MINGDQTLNHLIHLLELFELEFLYAPPSKSEIYIHSAYQVRYKAQH
ncbi:hypothetical protein X975_00601, partial [Stegodyphus mimosarum]